VHENSISSNAKSAQKHPLAIHAPEAAATIKFVTMDYFEKLLLNIGVPFPRCQDLPVEAFGDLNGNCMLVSISHGWFFQCHPDPFCEKQTALRDIMRNLRLKYPEAEILIFFDFLCLSQRPWKLGQAERTSEEQERFNVAVQHMHFCYCYSEAVIHLNLEAPPEDTEMHVAWADTDKLQLVEFGGVVQVIGLQEEAEHEDGLTAFDVVCKVDGTHVTSTDSIPDGRKHSLKSTSSCKVQVDYLRRPYGKTNATPVDERGWVYLERFITMLKAAMLKETAFDDCIFSNHEATTMFLRRGASQLRAASEGGGDKLKAELTRFQEDLFTKRFSAASTDKIVADKGSDSDIVSGLMEQLVETFSQNWNEELNKQQGIAMRFKADVPLLTLTRRNFKDALFSREPFVVLTCFLIGAPFGALIAAAVANAVKQMTVQAALLASTSGSLLSLMCQFAVQSPERDLGVAWSRVASKYVPLICFELALLVAAMMLLITYDDSWGQWYGHMITFTCVLLTAVQSCKLLDIFGCYASPVIKTSFKSQGRRLPGTVKKLQKGFAVGSISHVWSVMVVGYVQTCVSLRAVASRQPAVYASAIVLLMAVFQRVLMFTIASYALPKMKANFATTDATLFSINTVLTFGIRLLITSLNSNEAICACSMAASVLELATAVWMLRRTALRAWKWEAQATEARDEQETFGAKLSKKTKVTGGEVGKWKQAANDTLQASRKLLAARRQLSTEVIFLVNELFSEFVCTAATVAFGFILSDSSAVSSLSIEMTWDMLPAFLAAQYGPELLDAWLLVIYLRYLGVNWLDLGKAFGNARVVVIKSLSLMFAIWSVTLAGIDSN